MKRSLILSLTLFAAFCLPLREKWDESLVTDKAKKVIEKTTLTQQTNTDKEKTTHQTLISLYDASDRVLAKYCDPMESCALRLYRYNERHLLIEEKLILIDNSIERQVFVYNKKGDMLERTDYERDGSISYKETQEFDEQGHLLVYDNTHHGFPHGLKRVYTYDDIGRQTDMKEYNMSDGTTLGRWVYSTYDGQGNLIKRLESFQGGVTVHQSTFQYENKLLIEERRYDNALILIDSDRYSYNSHQDEIDYRKYDKDDRLIQRISTNYDAHHRKTRQQTYGKDGYLELDLSWSYDEKGRLAELSTSQFGALQQSKRVTYLYNNGGKVIEEASYLNGKLERGNSYQYDSSQHLTYQKRESYTPTGEIQLLEIKEWQYLFYN